MFEHYRHFYTTFELAGRDYTKMDYWDNKSIVYVYNCLAFRKDFQEELRIQQELAMKKR